MRSFAGADRFAVGPLKEFDHHFRYLGEAKDRICTPAIAGDAVAIKANALLQDPAGGLDRAAFDLVDNSVRIDRLADIHRNRQPLDPDILRALDLGDNGAIRPGVFVSGKANAVTAAGSLLRLPLRPLGNAAKNILRAWIAQIT